MANVTQSVPVTSKTFRNYLGAREKKVEQDKMHIEKLNEKAYKKMKNEKLAEKVARDHRITENHKQGKINDKF